MYLIFQDLYKTMCSLTLVASDSKVPKEVQKEAQVVIYIKLYSKISKMNFNIARTLECIRKHIFPQDKLAEINRICDV